MLSQLLHIINQPFIIIPFFFFPSWWLPQVGWINIPVQSPGKEPPVYLISWGWCLYSMAKGLCVLAPEAEKFMGNSSGWDLVEPVGS